MSSQAIVLPPTTRQRLEDFRRQVRRIKLAEGVLAGLFGLALSYVAVFIVDRFVDTPAVLRTAILIGGCLGFGLFFPLKCHRWVWRTRRMEQVATLLKHRFPALGDQLLGVVELARGDSDLGTSETLARAAVAHVDASVKDRDFRDAVPNPRHKRWAVLAAIPIGLMLLAMIVVPAAGANALQRWLMPWANVDRYTFAQVTDLPERIVVPHGEEFDFAAELKPETKWAPTAGTVRFNDQQPVTAELTDQQRYQFRVPPQTETGTLNVRIGDIRESLAVQVETRPELNSMKASIRLPDYLRYSKNVETDVRGGVVSVLKGSVTEFVAEVSRALQAATVAGKEASVEGSQIRPVPVEVVDSETLEFQWKDELGLTAKDGFQLKIKAIDDSEPNVTFQQLDPQQVVLTTDVISFDVQADDDFGLKEIGLEWRGIEDPTRNPNPDTGAKLVSGGSPEQTVFTGKTTFCALSDEVRAQSLEVRAYAVDYKPERGRTYSPTYVLHVLTPEEHAIWMTAQLRRWASLADDVYEEEMRLHDANRELRRLDANELNAPKTRRRIEQQAAAERANGQRLGAVTDHGEQLIKQAMRNKEMLVGHLETWADALEALKQISEKRMPSVADMLDSAAKAPGKQKPSDISKADSNSKSRPMAGNNRSDQTGPGEQKNNEPADSKPLPSVPQLVDVESGFNKSEQGENAAEGPAKKPSKGKLTLPTTVLNGGPKSESAEPPPPAEEQLDEAVEEQADLLADFAKVRDDLQKIMDDLESSTFVKRLKAASRRQLEVAEDLNRTLFKGFGVDVARLDARAEEQTERIAAQEEAQSQSVWLIQSDLEAYYDRRKAAKFLKIIEEMDTLQVTTKLTGIGDRVRQNMTGEAIARSEFWGDTLDRWAEELVEPSQCGNCPGCKSGDSLPPFVVLEIMRILEGEMDLRDETRAVEQAHDGIEPDQYVQRAKGLAKTQDELHNRLLQVVVDIRTLPNGAESFAKELNIIETAVEVMGETTGILSEPNTGPKAIAAETEVIELLLASKRVNPKGGGGGGGATPGGGGGGDTDTPALALYGPAADLKGHVRQRGVEQATGNSGDDLPAEFRDGLEAFFNAVEGSR
ncbi:MAG: hypothetical protein R3C59_28180 [Planctomycetaceae bacterium]